MNLIPINTGNLVPTGGNGHPHDPLVWNLAGFEVRVIIRPNLPIKET